MTTETLVEDTTYAIQREAARDLRRQVAELDSVEESEIIIRETSPARRRHILYSMEDGSEVSVFRYRVDDYLSRTFPDGSPRFTADKSKAPAFIEGNSKCFLHRESPEAEIVRTLGIGKTCSAAHLPNSAFARRRHAEKKHKEEWRIYSEHIREQEQEAWREEQRQQTAAMLAIAGQASPQKRGG